MPELDALTTTPFDKTFANDHPALIEWNPPLARDAGRTCRVRRMAPRPLPIQARYRGKVLLFTSTLNMDWNSWPGSPSFGAMMQETTRVAASGDCANRPDSSANFSRNIFRGSATKSTPPFTPPGENRKPQKVRTQSVEDTSVFRFADTDLSGIYKVTVGSEPREYLFAVNVPMTRPDQGGSESDLTRLDKNLLQALFPTGIFNWSTIRARRTTPRAVPVRQTTTSIPKRGAVGPILAHIALYSRPDFDLRRSRPGLAFWPLQHRGRHEQPGRLRDRPGRYADRRRRWHNLRRRRLDSRPRGADGRFSRLSAGRHACLGGRQSWHTAAAGRGEYALGPGAPPLAARSSPMKPGSPGMLTLAAVVLIFFTYRSGGIQDSSRLQGAHGRLARISHFDHDGGFVAATCNFVSIARAGPILSC